MFGGDTIVLGKFYENAQLAVNEVELISVISVGPFGLEVQSGRRRNLHYAERRH